MNEAAIKLWVSWESLFMEKYEIIRNQKSKVIFPKLFLQDLQLVFDCYEPTVWILPATTRVFHFYELSHFLHMVHNKFVGNSSLFHESILHETIPRVNFHVQVIGALTVEHFFFTTINPFVEFWNQIFMERFKYKMCFGSQRDTQKTAEVLLLSILHPICSSREPET